MFGKKVGEKRLATRKMSGKNKIVEKSLSLVKNSGTFPRLLFFENKVYKKSLSLRKGFFFYKITQKKL